METLTQDCDSFLLIVDYNLSRIDDVASMRRDAYQRYGIKTLLIRPNPTLRDYQISDHVLALDPRAIDFVAAALSALAPFRSQLRGGLVFSDNAVQSGAQLLERLNLPVDDATLATGAFSKIHYRQIEREHRSLLEPQGMFIPAYTTIHSSDELLEFIQLYPDGVVLKPACEGNNRGVTFLYANDDVQQALKEVEPYLSEGVVCEQIIPFEREYSFDGLGHLSFVTEKCSAEGLYPVETGQILPARLRPTQRHLIQRIGNLSNLLVGQCYGPFHNEIKIKSDEMEAAVVEPNRRPAGMRIWSLAERVYGLNFYQLWVDQVLGYSLPERLPAPKGIAATIMLGASCDGHLHLPQEIHAEPKHLFKQALNLYQSMGSADEIEWFGFTFLQPQACQVRAVPKENGDFLAMICVYSPNTDLNILGVKTAISSCWQQVIAPYICQKASELISRPVGI
jgi:hypothetical protein